MSITVIYGPMFAGKTTALIEACKNFEINQQKQFIIKPKMDDRYSQDKIVSHNGVAIKAFSTNKMPFNVLKDEYHCFLIDEIHMFGDDLLEFCKKARDLGKHVVAAGVEMQFDGIDFDCVKNLMKIADKCVYLQGKCGVEGCKEKSVYSHLKNNPNDPNENKSGCKIIVGGADLYIPICKKHFIKYLS